MTAKSTLAKSDQSNTIIFAIPVEVLEAFKGMGAMGMNMMQNMVQNQPKQQPQKQHKQPENIQPTQNIQQ